MKYRREIDGLRALAVIPVMLFHAGFKTFSGGFVGVDVFFVISGYLITSIIVNDLEKGAFSLVNFYERRARRILPALFLVVAVCVPFAWIFLSRQDLSAFSRSVASVSVYLSNFFFWRDGGYFNTASELKPLLHTWSLAVEEQYYLLFPLFLILAWRFFRRWIVELLATIGLASLLVAQWAAYHKPKADFFLLPTRAWELAIGAVIALYLAGDRKAAVPPKAGQALSFVGLLLILVSVFALNSDTPFPSVYALLPTVGAALIILVGTADTWAGSLLGGRIPVGIGLISYSAYLWHQPMLAFARHMVSEPSALLRIILCLIAFLLAFLSWRLVERPFRERKRFSRAAIFRFSAIGSAVLLSIGLVSASAFDPSSNHGGEMVLAQTLTLHPAIRVPSTIEERIFIRDRIQVEDLKPNVIVVGSSRVMQIGEDTLHDNVLNLAVSGASVEDLVAIADLATRKFRPSVLLVGADPWLFNSESGEDHWKALQPEYHDALLSIQTGEGLTEYHAPASSSSEDETGLVQSVANRIYLAVNRVSYGADDDTPGLESKIRRDGSRVYDTVYSSQSQRQIEMGLDDKMRFSMSSYKFSPKLYNEFEAFLVHYRQLKIRVVLVLSPYYPELFQRFASEDRVYLESETQFRVLAERAGVEIIGSYDPGKVGCHSNDFYDGMHPKGTCMERVLRPLSTTLRPRDPD